MATAEQWAATWRALEAAPREGVYEALMARYAEPHRHYHTQRHLAECFAQLADVRGETERIGEVELALWFHDAIYDTKRHDNEQRSAEWAREVIERAGLAPAVGERVAALVMATRHAAVPTSADARAVVDVDLAILGAPPERFDEYERDVRREYAWVPGILFRRERRKILRGFLERPRIFQTNAMHGLREQAARANLERSVRRLGDRRRAES
jgi:predicted metal-dependent HD superfamily phosphohydrolase